MMNWKYRLYDQAAKTIQLTKTDVTKIESISGYIILNILHLLWKPSLKWKK